MTDEPQRPTTDGRDAWRVHWQAQGMPWRTEPAIDLERQVYLAGRRAVKPDIEHGIYPFRDENGSIKLDRADVEWLLATLGSELLLADAPNSIRWTYRTLLDLRGADLRGVDVNRLPLMFLLGGPRSEDLALADTHQREMAAIHFEEANLSHARFDGAKLRYVHFEGADLTYARLDGATVAWAHFGGVNLRGAGFDRLTSLYQAELGDAAHGVAQVEGLRWGGANLAVVQWASVGMLGDERAARTLRFHGRANHRAPKLLQYEAAVRANRQLALALREQGLNEDGDHFAYRAQVVQRKVLRRQRSWGRWVFSWLLAILSGYGYRLRNILIAYGVTLIVFAAAYLLVGLPSMHPVPPVQAVADAFQVSLTAIHGRVFFEQFGIGSALAWVAAVESVVGIVIEGVFVAMLVQRFFAR